MKRTIKPVRFPAQQPKLLRVAAYARVSSGKDAMLHSLSAQVSFYSSLIQNHSGWIYCGVYSDEAITGTKGQRDGFQRMLTDCRNGKIDLIITKSISRFARNTVILLETIRELKALGVDVFFEEQNLHTMSADGELILTILASYAQEESLSASENQKWRVRKNFEAGMPWNGTLLGYRYDKGQYILVPKEAETVRRIFELYLSGLGLLAIAEKLNAENEMTRIGNRWGKNSVAKILKNYHYTGNLLLQKTYRENFLTKRTLINNGELPKYHALNTHEPIISLETFEAVQAEMARRAEKHSHPGVKPHTYPFTGMIVCANCGSHYRRKITATGPVWICGTYNTLGKAACASKQIPESVLLDLTWDINLKSLSEVRAENGNRIIFHFQNGETVEKHWQDRSRAESWTPEMREKARQQFLNRRKK